MKSIAGAMSVAILGLGLVSGFPGQAAADEFHETVAVEPGGTLYIHLDRGSVEVASHDEGVVQIHATAWSWGWCGDYRFDLRSEGESVHLDGEEEGFLSWVCGPRRVRVHALVPREYSVSVDTRGGRVAIQGIGGRVVARTSGGRIELQDVDGPATLKTSGGRIQVENLDGDLEARTSGGSIEIAYVYGDVEARTSGGRIEIKGARGRAIARTSGGRITASFDGPPSGVFETSGGSIVVWFAPDEGVDLDAKTSGGHVRVEHEILVRGSMNSRHIVGAMNGGGELLRLRTSGGNINVRAN